MSISELTAAWVGLFSF